MSLSRTILKCILHKLSEDAQQDGVPVARSSNPLIHVLPAGAPPFPLFPTPPPWASWDGSQINLLHPDSCLRVCFGETGVDPGPAIPPLSSRTFPQHSALGLARLHVHTGALEDSWHILGQHPQTTSAVGKGELLLHIIRHRRRKQLRRPSGFTVPY